MRTHLLLCLPLVAILATPVPSGDVFPQVISDRAPLVIVVHGIGGGNRPDGWSDDVRKAWNLAEVREVTFRYEGRTGADSFVDFARHGGDWTLDAQAQIKKVIADHPDRRVIVVSHSWGTVVTKVALEGGSAGGSVIDPLPVPRGRIDEWITIGSPLGRADSPDVAVNLRQLNVDVPMNRPAAVKHWTNFWDSDDPVSKQSHHLDGADNVEVSGSGVWWDVVGMTAHTGIWVNPVVINHMQSMVRTLATPVSPGPAPGSRPPEPPPVTPRPRPTVPEVVSPKGRSADEIRRLDVLCGCFLRDRLDYETQPDSRYHKSISTVVSPHFDVAADRCVGRLAGTFVNKSSGEVIARSFDWATDMAHVNPPVTWTYPQNCCSVWFEGKCWR
jgi:hypothetical protein